MGKVNLDLNLIMQNYLVTPEEVHEFVPDLVEELKSSRDKIAKLEKVTTKVKSMLTKDRLYGWPQYPSAYFQEFTDLSDLIKDIEGDKWIKELQIDMVDYFKAKDKELGEK